MEPSTGTGMETVTSIVTSMFTWIGSVATTISGNVLLLIPLGIALVSAAIGFGMRLMGTKKGRKR